MDAKSSAYVTGHAYSGFPVTPGAAQPVFGRDEDAFVTKFSATGATLTYSTYIGGSGNDYGVAINVDSSGNAYVAASTNSSNLPVTASALQPALAGGTDAFAAKLNSAGSAWTYLTYLGGTRDDYAYGLAVDSAGNALVAGFTVSSNFPQTNALQPSLAGNATTLFKTTSSGSSWAAAGAGVPDQVYSAIDPSSPSQLLAGTAGGLVQSSDGGGHWTVPSPFLGSFSVGVAFSPSGSPAYASALESVYSSVDGGTSWTFAGTAPCGVSSIAMDPAAPQTIYIANATADIYFYPACVAKSTDGGVTWTILTGLTFNFAVFGVAINPKSPNVLYAGTDSGLFKSTNAGQSWSSLDISGFTNPEVTGIAIDPNQPAIVYAVVFGELWKSTNAGSTWLQLPTVTFGVSSLAIAPSKPSMLYAGAYNGIYVSSDGGSTWSAAALTGDSVTSVRVSPNNPATAYAGVIVYSDAFVAKINTSGSKLTYSTYLGGTGEDYANGVAVKK